MIDRELRAKTYPTVDDLAKLAEVDSKTIRRDLQSLQTDYQAPIEYNRLRKGWEYTCDTYRLPAVIITEGELVAMFFAGQVLRQAHGTPYEADLRRAIEKLSEFLPDEVSLHWQALDQVQSFHQTVTSLQCIESFRQLADATIHHRRLIIRYWTASRDAEADREIDPYHLACVDGTWYLIAWCHRRNEIRTFATNRIRDVAETGHDFVPPRDFQLGDHFGGAFKIIAEKGLPLQTVRLNFVPSAGKFIREKVWHESQVCETHEDRSVTLTLALRSLIEVRRFALSWGSECQVLEPQQLKDDIRNEAEKIIAQSKSADGIPVQPKSAGLGRIRESLNQRRRQGKKFG